MNPKNLEGKTREQQKDLYEIELIADYEMEYGQEDCWSEETIKEFNKKWEEIQQRFKSKLPEDTEVELSCDSQEDYSDFRDKHYWDERLA